MAAPRSLPLPRATPTFVAPQAWQAIDFISDLHLAENTPRAFEAWSAHLRRTDADAVFILGDLFEAWVGDDMAERGFEARCVALLTEAAKTKAIAFMAGNRDFLVGDAMLQASGVMRLHDPTLIDAFGARVLVSHGDSLCLSDTGYQRYRAVVHRKGLQRAFLALPLSWRRAIGQKTRKHSDAARAPGSRSLVDVDADAVAGWLRDANASTLVHGHTHAPADHVLADGGVRRVLTDWELDAGRAPRAQVLRWTAQGFARLGLEQASSDDHSR